MTKPLPKRGRLPPPPPIIKSQYELAEEHQQKEEEKDKTFGLLVRGFMVWILFTICGWVSIPPEWLPLFSHAVGFGFYLVIITKQTRWLGALVVGAFSFLGVVYFTIPPEYYVTTTNLAGYVVVLLVLGVVYRNRRHVKKRMQEVMKQMEQRALEAQKAAEKYAEYHRNKKASDTEASDVDSESQGEPEQRLERDDRQTHDKISSDRAHHHDQIRSRPRGDDVEKKRLADRLKAAERKAEVAEKALKKERDQRHLAEGARAVAEEGRKALEKKVKDLKRKHDVDKQQVAAEKSKPTVVEKGACCAELVNQNGALQMKVDWFERELAKIEESKSDVQKRLDHALGQNIEGLTILELEALEKESSDRLQNIQKQKMRKLQLEYEHLKELRVCKVCQDREVQIVLDPCGHQCLCEKCGRQINQCPICRSDISRKLRTYHV